MNPSSEVKDLVALVHRACDTAHEEGATSFFASQIKGLCEDKKWHKSLSKQEKGVLESVDISEVTGQLVSIALMEKQSRAGNDPTPYELTLGDVVSCRAFPETMSGLQHGFPAAESGGGFPSEAAQRRMLSHPLVTPDAVYPVNTGLEDLLSVQNEMLDSLPFGEKAKGMLRRRSRHVVNFLHNQDEAEHTCNLRGKEAERAQGAINAINRDRFADLLLLQRDDGAAAAAPSTRICTVIHPGDHNTIDDAFQIMGDVNYLARVMRIMKEAIVLHQMLQESERVASKAQFMLHHQQQLKEVIHKLRRCLLDRAGGGDDDGEVRDLHLLLEGDFTEIYSKWTMSLMLLLAVLTALVDAAGGEFDFWSCTSNHKSFSSGWFWDKGTCMVLSNAQNVSAAVLPVVAWMAAYGAGAFLLRKMINAGLARLPFYQGLRIPPASFSLKGLVGLVYLVGTFVGMSAAHYLYAEKVWEIIAQGTMEDKSLVWEGAPTITSMNNGLGTWTPFNTVHALQDHTVSHPQNETRYLLGILKSLSDKAKMRNFTLHAHALFPVLYNGKIEVPDPLCDDAPLVPVWKRPLNVALPANMRAIYTNKNDGRYFFLTLDEVFSSPRRVTLIPVKDRGYGGWGFVEFLKKFVQLMVEAGHDLQWLLAHFEIVIYDWKDKVYLGYKPFVRGDGSIMNPGSIDFENFVKGGQFRELRDEEVKRSIVTFSLISSSADENSHPASALYAKCAHEAQKKDGDKNMLTSLYICTDGVELLDALRLHTSGHHKRAKSSNYQKFERENERKTEEEVRSLLLDPRPKTLLATEVDALKALFHQENVNVEQLRADLNNAGTPEIAAELKARFEAANRNLMSLGEALSAHRRQEVLFAETAEALDVLQATQDRCNVLIHSKEELHQKRLTSMQLTEILQMLSINSTAEFEAAVLNCKQISAELTAKIKAKKIALENAKKEFLKQQEICAELLRKKKREEGEDPHFKDEKRRKKLEKERAWDASSFGNMTVQLNNLYLQVLGVASNSTTDVIFWGERVEEYKKLHSSARARYTDWKSWHENFEEENEGKTNTNIDLLRAAWWEVLNLALEMAVSAEAARKLAEQHQKAVMYGSQLLQDLLAEISAKQNALAAQLKQFELDGKVILPLLDLEEGWWETFMTFGFFGKADGSKPKITNPYFENLLHRMKKAIAAAEKDLARLLESQGRDFPYAQIPVPPGLTTQRPKTGVMRNGFYKAVGFLEGLEEVIYVHQEGRPEVMIGDPDQDPNIEEIAANGVFHTHNGTEHPWWNTFTHKFLFFDFTTRPHVNGSDAYDAPEHLARLERFILGYLGSTPEDVVSRNFMAPYSPEEEARKLEYSLRLDKKLIKRRRESEKARQKAREERERKREKDSKFPPPPPSLNQRPAFFKDIEWSEVAFFIKSGAKDTANSTDYYSAAVNQIKTEFELMCNASDDFEPAYKLHGGVVKRALDEKGPGWFKEFLRILREGTPEGIPINDMVNLGITVFASDITVILSETSGYEMGRVGTYVGLMSPGKFLSPEAIFKKVAYGPSNPLFDMTPKNLYNWGYMVSGELFVRVSSTTELGIKVSRSVLYYTLGLVISATAGLLSRHVRKILPTGITHRSEIILRKQYTNSDQKPGGLSVEPDESALVSFTDPKKGALRRSVELLAKEVLYFGVGTAPSYVLITVLRNYLFPRAFQGMAELGSSHTQWDVSTAEGATDAGLRLLTYMYLTAENPGEVIVMPNLVLANFMSRVFPFRRVAQEGTAQGLYLLYRTFFPRSERGVYVKESDLIYQITAPPCCLVDSMAVHGWVLHNFFATYTGNLTCDRRFRSWLSRLDKAFSGFGGRRTGAKSPLALSSLKLERQTHALYTANPNLFNLVETFPSWGKHFWSEARKTARNVVLQFSWDAAAKKYLNNPHHSQGDSTGAVFIRNPLPLMIRDGTSELEGELDHGEVGASAAVLAAMALAYATHSRFSKASAFSGFLRDAIPFEGSLAGVKLPKGDGQDVRYKHILIDAISLIEDISNPSVGSSFTATLSRAGTVIRYMADPSFQVKNSEAIIADLMKDSAKCVRKALAFVALCGVSRFYSSHNNLGDEDFALDMNGLSEKMIAGKKFTARGSLAYLGVLKKEGRQVVAKRYFGSSLEKAFNAVLGLHETFVRNTEEGMLTLKELTSVLKNLDETRRHALPIHPPSPTESQQHEAHWDQFMDVVTGWMVDVTAALEVLGIAQTHMHKTMSPSLFTRQWNYAFMTDAGPHAKEKREDIVVDNNWVWPTGENDAFNKTLFLTGKKHRLFNDHIASLFALNSLTTASNSAGDSMFTTSQAITEEDQDRANDLRKIYALGVMVQEMTVTHMMRSDVFREFKKLVVARIWKFKDEETNNALFFSNTYNVVMSPFFQ